MSTSSCGRRYEGRRCEGWPSILEAAASGGDLQDREEEHVAARCDGKSKERERKETQGETKAGRRAARGERGGSEKGKNERGGETGKRDEAEIQKVLTS